MYKLNYENILQKFRKIILDGNRSYLDESSIILPGKTSTLSSPVSLELSLGHDDSEPLCETITVHTDHVDIVIGTSLSNDHAGRAMLHDLAVQIIELFDPTDYLKRIFHDADGNKICIHSAEQKSTSVSEARLTVGIRLQIKIYCKH